MVKLSKKDLVNEVSENLGITKKEAEAVLEAYLDAIAENLKFGNVIDLYGFGKFEVKTRAARSGINPLTKEPLEIPATKVIGFKPSSALKNKVND